MNIKKTSLDVQKICCSRYSEFDDMIIEKASSLGLPLIGGTAVEVLGGHFSRSGFRKRSNNDLDFTSNDKAVIDKFSAWLRSNVDPNKVKVDVMYVRSHTIPESEIMNVGGCLVMSPEYLVWSKSKRMLARDVTDIMWLLESVDFDKLEFLVNSLGLTDRELDLLNGVIEKVSVAIADAKSKYSCGCLMLDLSVPFMSKVQDLIDFDDLHDFGLEAEPHVTVFYGSDIRRYGSLASVGPLVDPAEVSVKFSGVSLFENPSYDVLKFDILSSTLHSMHKDLSESLGVTSDFPDYIPHCTIAYLKPGMGAKYVRMVYDVLEDYTFPIVVLPVGWVYSTGSND